MTTPIKEPGIIRKKMDFKCLEFDFNIVLNDNKRRNLATKYVIDTLGDQFLLLSFQYPKCQSYIEFKIPLLNVYGYKIIDFLNQKKQDLSFTVDLMPGTHDLFCRIWLK